MTHFSDSLAVGGAITNTVIGSQGGYGVQTAQSIVMDIQPLTKNAAALAASQSPASAALTLSAGTSVTAIVVNGQTRYVLDTPRAVTITSGGNDTGIAFLISGYDVYGKAMSQLLTGASGSVATTKKAFASVTSIVPNGAVATTVTAGTADLFGIPIRLIDKGYISSLNWANVLAYDTGTMTIYDSTSPATNLTGDVRGTYVPSTASDGSKRLILEVLLSTYQTNANGGAAATTAILGVTQA